MFERHGFEQFEKTMPAEQPDPDSIKRIHEAGVAIKEISLLPDNDKDFHHMEIASVVSDASRRLRLAFSDGHTDFLTELSGKHAVVGPRINHAGEHELKLAALVFEESVDLRARDRRLLWEGRRWLARRRRVGNNYLGGCGSRQRRSLNEHKADTLIRYLDEQRTPLFDLSGSSEGLVKALSVAKYPLLVLRQRDPLALVGLE